MVLWVLIVDLCYYGLVLVLLNLRYWWLLVGFAMCLLLLQVVGFVCFLVLGDCGWACLYCVLLFIVL